MPVNFTNNGDKIKDEFEAAVKKALTTCGLEAQKYARNLCPTDTGLLKNSIAYACGGETPKPQKYTADKVKKGKTKKESGEYKGSAPEDKDDLRTVYIGTRVEYAPEVELGTNKKKAQPFLAPAVSQHVDKYKKIIQQELKGK